MTSQELFALLDESFVLVDHLRFITRRRTALDRRGVSRTAAQFKRELSEHKLAASCRARQGTARASKAAGLAERLAERLAAYRELESRFAELLRVEGEATQVCLSAEGALEAVYTDLADENRRLRAAAAAARERAENTIEQAAATHEATRRAVESQKRCGEAQLQLCLGRVLQLGPPRRAMSTEGGGARSPTSPPRSR